MAGVRLRCPRRRGLDWRILGVSRCVRRHCGSALAVLLRTLRGHHRRSADRSDEAAATRSAVRRSHLGGAWARWTGDTQTVAVAARCFWRRVPTTMGVMAEAHRSTSAPNRQDHRGTPQWCARPGMTPECSGRWACRTSAR